jgi:hypothetical protein
MFDVVDTNLNIKYRLKIHALHSQPFIKVHKGLKIDLARKCLSQTEGGYCT